VFEAHSPLNTPRSRTHGAIALAATGKAGGAFYFLSLASGEVISRHQWTICPIQEEVIGRFEILAMKDKQPLIQSTGLVVEWGQVHPGTPHINIEDEDGQMEENEISQKNDDLMIMTSGNNLSEDEELESTVIRDDQELESEQNIQAPHDNTLYENQGAERKRESIYSIAPEHDTNDIQEYNNNTDEHDNEHVTETSVNDEDGTEHELYNEEDQTIMRTEDQEETGEAASEGGVLIKRDQGVTYNLRNRQTI